MRWRRKSCLVGILISVFLLPRPVHPYKHTGCSGILSGDQSLVRLMNLCCRLHLHKCHLPLVRLRGGGDDDMLSDQGNRDSTAGHHDHVDGTDGVAESECEGGGVVASSETPGSFNPNQIQPGQGATGKDSRVRVGAGGDRSFERDFGPAGSGHVHSAHTSGGLSDGEGDCGRYVEMMKKCAEQVGEGKADPIDGYGILHEAIDAGGPVTLELFNQLLKVCAEAAKDGRAGTVDGSRVFEQIESHGLRPRQETYELMLELIANGAAPSDQTAYLSQAFTWAEKMSEDVGLTEKAAGEYIRCYNNQWPNVCELNMMQVGWTMLDDRQEKLWAGDPERGIEPDPAADYSLLVHNDDMHQLPRNEGDLLTSEEEGEQASGSSSHESTPHFSDEAKGASTASDESSHGVHAFDSNWERVDVSDEDEAAGGNKPPKAPEYLLTPRGCERNGRYSQSDSD